MSKTKFVAVLLMIAAINHVYGNNDDSGLAGNGGSSVSCAAAIAARSDESKASAEVQKPAQDCVMAVRKHRHREG